MNDAQIELDIVYHIAVGAHQLGHQDSRYMLAARWIADRFGLKKLYASVAIVDDSTMQQLNAELLGHDWPTDVISFELDAGDDSVEGEVIASAETAARICVAAGWSAEDELLLYVIHGLLHVAGMDDVEPAPRQEMRLTEQECLLAVGVSQADEHLQRWDGIYNGEFSE